MQAWVAARPTAFPSCYSILDRGAVPQPVEDASEAAWREFDACWEALERRVAEAPWELLQARREAPRTAGQGPGEHRPPVALVVDDVMRLARMNDRVCPAAPSWMKLHQLLHVVLQPRRSDPAPHPVDAADWSRTTDLQKRLRLREQLAWAQHHGGLHVAHEFLRSLPEEGWHHLTPQAWPAL